MTNIDLDALDPRDRYKLLTAIVVPRPVAWVTTVSEEGVTNAAPYSFFNLFGQDPALVVLGIERHEDGRPKDTARNIDRGRTFVVNILTPALAEQMVATAASYDPRSSEIDALGLATAPSATVDCPRLADAPAAIECRHKLTLSFGPERDLVIGEAIGLHARHGLVDMRNMHVDWQGDWPIARLFADRYARLEEIERRKIPDLAGGARIG